MQPKKSTLRETVGHYLLFLVVAELALMGGGRPASIGPITVRMLLYIAAICWTIWEMLHGKRLRIESVLIVVIFLVVVTFGAVLGLMDKADGSILMENVKPLSYFLMLPFFEIAITRASEIAMITKILRYCGLVLAGVYLFACLIQLLGLISPGVLYLALNFMFNTENSVEIMARNDPATAPVLLFTYKGFIFMCIAAVIWAQTPGKRKIYSVICVLAIGLTLVRGYFLALATAWMIYLLFFQKRAGLRLIGISTVLILTLGSIYMVGTNRDDGAVSESNRVRQQTIQQVTDRATLTSAFIGHGLGIGVPERPDSMEITYIQVFHQQGALGLCFWLYILISNTFFVIKISRHTLHKDAIIFYLITVMVFVETGTNPTLNNPIGMGAVLIAFVVLRKIYLDVSNTMPRKSTRWQSKFITNYSQSSY